jgi:hypothetical protein
VVKRGAKKPLFVLEISKIEEEAGVFVPIPT